MTECLVLGIRCRRSSSGGGGGTSPLGNDASFAAGLQSPKFGGIPKSPVGAPPPIYSLLGRSSSGGLSSTGRREMGEGALGRATGLGI